ncbi:phage minor head protein [Achromobacter sp. 2789STDY5608628]|uniref:phage head morphogenesis protein n=1 Tax=Achromobacter sp. 2789STDY5608628 TaxID=1806493 RepID=UPI0006C4B6D9|nr:phage minor head protein [Achromobacter sp. 2789STDY5608628]CUJ80780.1 NAD(+)--arginine ADP-ribosyltransferase EFV [Achromobacter sp. 2789STDY5608628]
MPETDRAKMLRRRRYVTADGRRLQAELASGLVSPTGRDQALRPVHANQGIEAAYRKRLDRLIDEMQRSLVYWLTAAYRRNVPEIAQDESPAMALTKMMRRLAKQWQRRFDEAAQPVASEFAETSMSAADVSLRNALRQKGFSVQFQLTRAANDVFQATVQENVGLIKSIAAEHLQDVQGLVMRSVTQGRDLEGLVDDLQKRYGVTKRRAAFIARDQNNKATATITRVRQQGLGIKQAKWRHSRGGKHPRKSHQEADGNVYDVDKGMLIDGEYIRPGELPNCRCVAISIIPGFDP